MKKSLKLVLLVALFGVSNILAYTHTINNFTYEELDFTFHELTGHKKNVQISPAKKQPRGGLALHKENVGWGGWCLNYITVNTQFGKVKTHVPGNKCRSFTFDVRYKNPDQPSDGLTVKAYH